MHQNALTSLVDRLYADVPLLETAIWSSHWITERDDLWALLTSLMEAHSPSGNVALPGTIIDGFTSAVYRAGLGRNLRTNFRHTGNAAILLGKEKSQVDLFVDAHLDKPTFGIGQIKRDKQRQLAQIFACCANRFPSGAYQVAGKALRYDPAQQAVVVSGKGVILSRRGTESGNDLFFEVTEGHIDPTDVVTLDTPPLYLEGMITGSGIDDAAGVTLILATASILKSIEPLLEARSLNVLFHFSDQEEWPPDSFFAQGASRTAFALQPPTLGSIIVDVHTADEGYSIQLGHGISCGFLSAQGRGAIVPLNYRRLTTQLMADLNTREPNCTQQNDGYFSRSDEHALMRWSRILGLLGVPARNIHLGEETAHLDDIRGGIILLSHYIPIVLGICSTTSISYSLAT